MSRTALIDLTGLTFGRWTVVCRHAVNGSRGEPRWVCRCVCGTERAVMGTSLRSGKSQSCGCAVREISVRTNTVHGMSYTAEHRLWSSMKERCYNPRRKDYVNYGGRGITVCERWRDSFAAFYEDVGPRPSPNLSIDRIDNDGNYEPGNVRWATRSEQNKNRRRK